MKALFATLRGLLARDGAAALVTVTGSRGSAPREPGARMVVSRDGDISGTIGGGRLELEVIDAARGLLAAGADDFRLARFALGPQLGQCCGGHMTIGIEAFTTARLDAVEALAVAEAVGPFGTEAEAVEGRPLERRIVDREPGLPIAELSGGILRERFGRALRPVVLFGAGHVGRAVVMALAPLPFRIIWVDERREMFPRVVPAAVEVVATVRPAEVASRAEAGSFVLVMTHDHATDLDIVDAALRNDGITFLGVIGSATKRARFESRLRSMGHDGETAARFRCPIGVPGLRSKEPAHIAAAVALELLIEDERAVAGARDAGRTHITAVG